MAANEKVALFVTGAPGSGCHIVGNALTLCGYTPGRVSSQAVSRLSALKVRSIPTLYVQEAVMETNEAMLRSVGLTRFDVKLVQDYHSTEVIEPSMLFEPFEAMVEQTIRDCFDEAALSAAGLVFHDPAFAYTYPIWAKVLSKMGYESKALLVHRGHLEAYGEALESDHDLMTSQFAFAYSDYSLAALRNLPVGTRILSMTEFEADPFKALPDLQTANSNRQIRIKDLADFSRAPRLRGVKVQNPISHGISAFIGQMADISDELVESQKYLTRVRMLENSLKAQDKLCLVDRNQEAPSISPDRPQLSRRPIVIHIHLFKNAGTSVDGILKKNFGAEWQDHEFPTPHSFTNSDLVRRHVIMRPHIKAFSTHTGNWLYDENDPHFDVIPIVFVRHPILRVRSAYTFERSQAADTEGAKLARQTDFAGYVRARLDNDNDYSFNNFQSRRLSFFTSRLIGNEEIQSLRAIEKLPFVGRVEEFDRSMQRFSEMIRQKFPAFEEFSLKANVSNDSDLTTDQMLDMIRSEIGDELYSELENANKADLALMDYVEERHFS